MTNDDERNVHVRLAFWHHNWNQVTLAETQANLGALRLTLQNARAIRPCMRCARTAVFSATTPASEDGDSPSIVRMLGASCASERLLFMEARAWLMHHFRVMGNTHCSQ